MSNERDRIASEIIDAKRKACNFGEDYMECYAEGVKETLAHLEEHFVYLHSKVTFFDNLIERKEGGA